LNAREHDKSDWIARRGNEGGWRSFGAGCLALGLVSCASAASSSPSDDGGLPADRDASIQAPDDAAGAQGTGADVSGPDDASAGDDGPVSVARDAGGVVHDAGPVDSGAPRDGGGPSALNYMVGIKTNSVPTGPAKVETWLGRPLDIAGTTITTTSYIGSGAPYTTMSGAHPLLECSFPLLSIFGESNALSDLGQAASGAYDATYGVMAKALASWKNPLISVRIGWELNGTWYKWSNGQGTNATYANFVAAFKRAAVQVRKQNPNVLVQWNLAWGQEDPTPYWPGAYDANTNPGGVDVISMDFYQANISQYNNGGKQSSWSLAQSGVTIDLDWMVTFAKNHNVKIALSEYGAGSPSSGGETSGKALDDGAWTAASIAWMNAQPPGFFLWTLWSDDAPADDIVTQGANPAEQSAWTAAWQGTHYGATWWRGTPPP
jgi:hypothetical protein